MKNVRLFAVAAALGMFASTVAAAETTTTKTVTWSGDDEVIRVEIGDTVIAPKVTASVVLDAETAACGDGLVDANKDGFADKDAYMMPATNYGSEASDWFWTATKYWPSSKTAMYYIGLGGGSITGGRFLAPGQAENEGTYTLGSSHKNLDGIDAVYSYLEENGAIKTTLNEDGDIESIEVGSYVTDDKTHTVKAFVVPTGLRKAEEVAKENIVNYFATGATLENSDNGKYYDVVYYSYKNIATDDEEFTYYVEDDNGKSFVAKAGDVIIVKQKRGDYYYVGKTTFSNSGSKQATATRSDLADDANGKYLFDNYDLAANTTYAFLGEKDSEVSLEDAVLFTTSNVKYLSAGEKAYSASYKKSAAKDTINAIVYKNKAGADVVVEVEDEDLYYVNDKGQYTSVSELNDQKDIKFEDLNGKGLRYGNTVITNATLLTDAEYAVFDADKGLGYEAVSASSIYYENFTVDGKVAYPNDKEYSINNTEKAGYNRISSLGKADKITFVEVENDFDMKDIAKYTDAVRILSQTVNKKEKGSTDGLYTFNYETMSFELDPAVDKKATDSLTGDDKEKTLSYLDAGHFNGLYYIVSPENDSDYYVLLTHNNDVQSGIDLGDAWTYSTRREEGYYELSADETLTTKLVELDGNYYPAFDTEDELVEFVTKVAGIAMLEGSSAKADAKTDFYKWYKAASKEVEDEIVTLSEALPTSAKYNLHGAAKCTYTVSEEAKGVTVEVGTVDTSTAGVKDLVYTAKYNGEEVGTTTVKVVVAPKYVRTWENGRVKTLTSYYVSNPDAKYAEYNYDWANGTVAITYYNVDGSVASNSTNSLK